MTDLILDLSEFQDCVDFERLKNNGVIGVILRIGYGRRAYQFDKSFSDFYTRAREAGLLIGGYWYSYLSKYTPTESQDEVEACLSVINGRKFDLPIFYDIEEPTIYTYYNKKELTNSILDFCNFLKKQGYRAGVYSGFDFTNDRIDIEKIREKSGFYFWLADWSSKPHLVCDLWQYTEIGKINGVSHNGALQSVDFNKIIDKRILPDVERYVTVTKNSKLRSGAYCGGNSKIIKGISKGEKVIVLADDGYGWCYVKCGKKYGYTQNTRLTPNNTLSKYPKYITNSVFGTHIRKEPNGKILDTVRKGTILTVRYIIEAGENKGWCEVAYPLTNSVSYVHSGQLKYILK